MDSVLPVIVTRESLLRMAGFEPVRDVAHAINRTREALDAVKPERLTITDTPEGQTVKHEKGGAPDWDIRLRASDQIQNLADVAKPRAEEPPSDRPVNVAIVLHAGSALQTHGVEIHLDGDHGR